MKQTSRGSCEMGTYLLQTGSGAFVSHALMSDTELTCCWRY